jgi:hypothetical protein
MKCNPAQEITTLCSSIVQTGHSGSQGKGSESAKVEAEGERERERKRKPSGCSASGGDPRGARNMGSNT